MKVNKKKLDELAKKGMESFSKSKIGAEILKEQAKELRDEMNRRLVSKMFK